MARWLIALSSARAAYIESVLAAVWTLASGFALVATGQSAWWFMIAMCGTGAALLFLMGRAIERRDLANAQADWRAQREAYPRRRRHRRKGGWQR